MTLAGINTIDLEYAYEELFFNLDKAITINATDKELLKEVFTVRYYPKNSYFIKEGEKAKRIGYILKGASVNHFYLLDKHVICRFYLEGSFMSNAYNFMTQTYADASIQFYENTTVFELDYNAYSSIKKKFPKIIQFLQTLQYDELSFYRKRVVYMQLKKAKERFEELLNEDRRIMDRFKMSLIADYLGVEKETVSRICNNSGNYSRIK